ncbi:pyridoxal-phosphate dependent enzyme [Ancylobacter dichloromethanicus]|uniref:Pyridoxal-5'-phosphate-dependent protein subunit beta n=1 Tax=Ancylobacter dichloromethanicus TaxID=518825 RepID=A0A9W6JAX2_9HYPH|nr:pyridoxal-phosphate dependent enzyme [Ancylobacter dichloromethanicus]MBS7552203.1 pyridoxal-phosphate dependent enzyme [Ancylobacter dichloromethanicus]GLK73937.1 pyridoxal-5'-phosphate-dependent protein subunit beta [Ancylobacter dichloromethanicus]
MNPFELPSAVADAPTYQRNVAHLRARGIVLPRFSELAAPDTLPAGARAMAATADSNAPDARNLFGLHWFNAAATLAGKAVPAHIELPSAVTGVPARIVVMLGRHFPMIHAHKVLAAYACLAPRLVTGMFDPTRHRAVWPSTGNYCRGGVAISRILGCHGVAVLPGGMSAERFNWLEQWVTDPADIVRTPGTESNVKEIYDACAQMAKDESNFILNQFSEFPNYLAHYAITGAAAGALFEGLSAGAPGVRLAAFVAGTGSAGTLGAGDHLKETYGARIVAMEPVECPTLLYNGFGEHNIQGIGDKHVPLIHNVTNTDIVAGVSDAASDDLALLFGTPAGRAYLAERRGVDAATLDGLASLGLSGIGNVLAAIKTARRLDLDADDLVLTVATDGAALYASERAQHLARKGGSFDQVSAGEAFGQHLLGAGADHVLELDHRDRQRVFNLGYYTWVEQQGISVEDFERRRHQRFWRGLREHLAVFDELIARMNRDIGIAQAA